MADLNALRDKVLSSLNTLADKTKEVAGAAADKAKDTAAVAKLNLEIASQRDRIKKAYTEIGKLYYETYKDEPNTFFVQLCTEVTLSLERISELEDAIERIKSNPDNVCDIEVEFDSVVSADEEKACSQDDFVDATAENTDVKSDVDKE